MMELQSTGKLVPAAENASAPSLLDEFQFCVASPANDRGSAALQASVLPTTFEDELGPPVVSALQLDPLEAELPGAAGLGPATT